MPFGIAKQVTVDADGRLAVDVDECLALGCQQAMAQESPDMTKDSRTGARSFSHEAEGRSGSSPCFTRLKLNSKRYVEGRTLGRQIFGHSGEERAALRESQCKEEKRKNKREPNENQASKSFPSQGQCICL